MKPITKIYQYNNLINNYFLFLFSILPISILVGSAISLANLVLIDISFIILCFTHKEWSWLNNKITKVLFIIYIYLIFNSLISIDPQNSIIRSVGFIRFIIFFVALNYILKENRNLIFIKFWFLILLVVCFDVFFEHIVGVNIFGFGAAEIDGVRVVNGKRIQSFFKDEAIVGAYLFGFSLIIIGYLISKSFKFEAVKNKSFILFLISFLFLMAIVVTGERSNFIRFSLCFIFILFYFFKNYSFLKKTIVLFMFLLSAFFVISKSENLNARYNDQLINQINSKEKIINFLEKSTYFKIYRSSIEVFKNYPIFGVGNKNYRKITCVKIKDKESPLYQCNTHSHQIYFELLSEHGIVGSCILIFLILFLIFRAHLRTYLMGNYLQFCCLTYLISNFIPILPSGSFFSDFNSNFFWINFSIFYACNLKTNIFLSNKI